MKYPPPSYASMIWMARGQIHLEMDGHVVLVDPGNKEWPRVLLDILRERDRLGHPAKIAQPASITQWQLENALRQHVGRKKNHVNLEELFDDPQS